MNDCEHWDEKVAEDEAVAERRAKRKGFKWYRYANYSNTGEDPSSEVKLRHCNGVHSYWK